MAKLKESPQHRTARLHLRKADPVMKKIITGVGPCALRKKRDRFATLVGSIISQQVSTAAAKAIQQRLVSLVEPDDVEPASLARLSSHQLRSVGLSKQKTGYIQDLTRLVNDGGLQLSQIGRRNDEEVIEQLTQVKGIGVWTAQMFLIFSLGRLDVLPHGDLGIQTAIRKQYSLRKLPSKRKIEQLARPWRPYASIASWYLWRSLQND